MLINETYLKALLFQLFAAALYLLLRRRMQHAAWNRGILLSIYLLPFLLWIPQPRITEEIPGLLPYTLPEIHLETGASSSSWSWQTLLFLPGLFILLSTFTALVKMVRLRVGGQVAREGGLFLIRHNSVTTPFSFFSWIFLPVRKDPDMEKWVLLHENVHARQWHSLDVLIARVVRAFFWVNPLLYFLEKELTLNHEYLADRACMEKESEKSLYTEALVNSAMRTTGHFHAHSFSLHSQLKQRILMINHSFTLKKGGYFFLLPLLAASLLWVACQQKQQEAEVPGVTPVEERQALKADEVEEMPEMIGGTEALIAFLSKEIKYPEAAKEEGLSARVMVEFTVTGTGAIADAKVLTINVQADEVTRKSPKRTLEENVEFDKAFETEALRAVNAMPVWKPGKKNGKPVPVKMVLPISFKL